MADVEFNDLKVARDGLLRLSRQMAAGRRWVAAVMVLAEISSAKAADISVHNARAGEPPVVSIIGEIDPDDGGKFSSLVAGLPNAIVGLESPGGNMLASLQIGEIIRHRPARFSVLSGDDLVTLQVMADGGDGVVSVTSNAAPALVAKLTELAAAGDFAGARDINHQIAEWTAAAFVESNPIPVKAGLAMMGKMANVVRLPLVPLAEKFEATVRAALISAGALTA